MPSFMRVERWNSHFFCGTAKAVEDLTLSTPERVVLAEGLTFEAFNRRSWSPVPTSMNGDSNNLPTLFVIHRKSTLYSGYGNRSFSDGCKVDMNFIIHRFPSSSLQESYSFEGEAE